MTATAAAPAIRASSQLPLTAHRIDVQKPTSFAAADVGRGFYTGSTTFAPGGAGCITVVRVAYPIPVYLPILSPTGVSTAGQTSFNGSMAYVAQSAAVFRNEPFTAGASTCG